MLKTLAMLCLLALMPSCLAPQVTTGITAYAQPGAAARKRFVLQGPDPRYPGGDPSWPVFSRILTRALEAKGFVPDPALPELIIRVSYRVGDTQTHTSSSVIPAPTDAKGVPIGPAMASTCSSESTLRSIQLEALDPSARAGDPAVVWSIHARSRGCEEDLAEVLPAMAAAMEDYFARSAPTLVDVRKQQSDPEVERLRRP
jgi:hypothetical protein